MTKVRNTLLTLGLLAALATAADSIGNVFELSRIATKTPYKQVEKINSKICDLESRSVEDFLKNKNGMEKFSELRSSYNDLLNEKSELLKNDEISSLDNKKNYLNEAIQDRSYVGILVGSLICALGSFAKEN